MKTYPNEKFIVVYSTDCELEMSDVFTTYDEALEYVQTGDAADYKAIIIQAGSDCSFIGNLQLDTEDHT